MDNTERSKEVREALKIAADQFGWFSQALQRQIAAMSLDSRAAGIESAHPLGLSRHVVERLRAEAQQLRASEPNAKGGK